MSDHDIVELYFRRDETAIHETEKKFSRLCFGIAKNILGNNSDAEECVNDTYLGVWNAIPPKRPVSLAAFVAKVARNLSLKRFEYNTAAKRSSFEHVEFSELAEVLADEDADKLGGEEDIGALINEFLLTEKEASRNVFLRKYWFFDSVEDIARRYSYSESKVKSMLFQTRTRLKKFFSDRGINV